jgi:CheY-like chemotaxis protein
VIQSTPPFQPGFAPPIPPAGAFEPPSDQTDGEGSEPGRRGKTKRKRFNFAVREGLEKLEKMVQSKRTETAAGSEAAPSVDIQAAPVEAPSIRTTPVYSPPVAPPAAPQIAPAETLPLQFEAPEATDEPQDQAVSAEPEAEIAEPEAEVAEPEAEVADAETQIAEPEAEIVEPEAETVEPEAETVTAEPEPVEADSRRESMRSMLFGEEHDDRSAVEPEPKAAAETEVQEPAVAEAEPVETPVAEEPASRSVAAASFWGKERGASVEIAPQPSAAEPGPPAEEQSSRGDSAGTVVIIEDDHSVAQYYAALFKGNGFRVEVANDGVSGVDLCTRVQPDVILLDVMMPRQNGILVLQTLRASDETRNTPVVVLSNFTEPTLIKRALQLGALEYVIKTQVEGPALLEAMPHWMRREKAFAAAA